uniref:Uncharacterized protein n=1 Tax=Cacopsylla melanoneura TaxID=428564 RepID=A0A8D8RL90_9HEMI
MREERFPISSYIISSNASFVFHCLSSLHASTLSPSFSLTSLFRISSYFYFFCLSIHVLSSLHVLLSPLLLSILFLSIVFPVSLHVHVPCLHPLLYIPSFCHPLSL